VTVVGLNLTVTVVGLNLEDPNLLRLAAAGGRVGMGWPYQDGTDDDVVQHLRSVAASIAATPADGIVEHGLEPHGTYYRTLLAHTDRSGVRHIGYAVRIECLLLYISLLAPVGCVVPASVDRGKGVHTAVLPHAETVVALPVADFEQLSAAVIEVLDRHRVVLTSPGLLGRPLPFDPTAISGFEAIESGPYTVFDAFFGSSD
jgi:hypothetical protein